MGTNAYRGLPPIRTNRFRRGELQLARPSEARHAATHSYALARMRRFAALGDLEVAPTEPIGNVPQMRIGDYPRYAFDAPITRSLRLSFSRRA